MPATITHSKVSTIPDCADSSLVRPSDWNAAHTVDLNITPADFGDLSATSKLLGSSSSSAAVTEITLGTNLSMSGSTLNGPATVTDATLTFSDITTNNASSAKHGFLPKLSASASQYLNGEGNWTTPSGIVNSYVAQAFSAQTSVTVTHNFGAYPIVQVINGSGAAVVPYTITHASINAFTVTFTSSSSGTILASVGSPQPASYVTVSDNYTLLSGDYFVECTAAGKTMTLPTAVGRQGQTYSVDNSSSGDVDVTTTSSQTIHGNTTVTLPANAVVTVVSNGANWRIK